MVKTIQLVACLVFKTGAHARRESRGMTKSSRTIKITLMAAGLFTALLLMSLPAMAQCAMCKAAIEGSANAEEAARGLSLASLVLLIPPVVIFSGLFGLFYRFRNVQGKREHPPVNY